MSNIFSALTLGHFLTLGAVLFCISVAGIFLNRKNVIMLLMSLELLLLSVNINFVAFSRSLGDPSGQRRQGEPHAPCGNDPGLHGCLLEAREPNGIARKRTTAARTSWARRSGAWGSVTATDSSPSPGARA